MHDKIAMILVNECKIHAEDLLLVGVSGGPDSLCLLHVLHCLGYRLIIAHINHQLRHQAAADEAMVKRLASDMGVECLSTQVDVSSYAEEHSISIEEAARLLRYHYLFEQAHEKGAKAVVVGHNADDQVETILMHFLRGSGLSGLRGMDFLTVPNPWSDHIPLLRPLLNTSKEEIQGYLSEHHLEPVFDQSNQDTSYFRNRLRLELIPYLEGYNPGIRGNLLRLAQIVRDDYEVLQNNVENAWEKVLIKQGPIYLAFRQAKFMHLPISIQRYLLRKAINYHLPGLRDVGLESIERCMNFLNRANVHGQVDVLAGVRIIKDGDVFWVVDWQAELPVMDFPAIMEGQQLNFEIPSTLILENGWKLQSIEMTNPRKVFLGDEEKNDPFETWLTTDDLSFPLTVRCRRAGDFIRPLGMHGHSVKLSDLMINLKIPKRARNTWPLVCTSEEVIWLPGYRVCQRASVKPNSQRIFKLTLSRESAS
jgi:tRNA(Ile)-lysidine synthase